MSQPDEEIQNPQRLAGQPSSNHHMLSSDTAFHHARAVNLMLQNLAIMQQILSNARGIALLTIKRARATDDPDREKAAENMLQNITRGELLFVQAQGLASATITGELTEAEALAELGQIHREVKHTATIFHEFRVRDVRRRAL